MEILLSNLLAIFFLGSMFLYKLSENYYDKDKLSDHIKTGGLIRRGLPRTVLSAKGVIIQNIALVLIILFIITFLPYLWMINDD